MAREKDSKTIKIELLFSKEFEQIREKTEIKEYSIEIKDKETEFQVYPEYDLPYKLYALYLSKNDIFKNMSEFNTDSFSKDNDLCSHNGSGIWKYYLYQLPNAEELFGIRCELEIQNIDKVLQTPIYFLVLSEVLFWSRDSKREICPELYKEMYKYANIALKAYEDKKRYVGFTREQLVNCAYFFFGENIFDNNARDEIHWVSRRNLGIWGKDGREVEDVVHKEVNRYISEMPEDFDQKGNAIGALFSFPKYLRSIMGGIMKNLEFFPFSSLDEKPLDKTRNTLWSKKFIFKYEGVAPDTSEAFTNCFSYIYMKNCLDEVMDLFFVSFEDDDFEDTQLELERYLERYCKLCEGILSYVNKDKKYENIVFYAFERIFSVLLIKEEADILWDLIQDIVEQEIQQNQTLNRDKEEYSVCSWLIEELGSQIFYEIACSPGIHHRIKLANYIFHNYLNKELLV